MMKYEALHMQNNEKRKHRVINFQNVILLQKDLFQIFFTIFFIEFFFSQNERNHNEKQEKLKELK